MDWKLCIVGVVALCSQLTLIQARLDIPVFITNGSYYEVGFSVGKHFKTNIQDFYSLQKLIETKYLPFVRSEAGQKIFAGYLSTVRKSYPQYLEELIGISGGAEIPFIKIFSMAIHNELNAHIDGVWKTEHCTDVHVNNQNQVAIGHNEDADPLIKSRGYFVNATIIEGGKIQEQFTAYTYPGNLPGNAFSFNSAGLVFTLNGLYPKYVGDMKIPRNFVNRALLAQTTQDGVEKVLLSDGIGNAYAFSLNFADTSKKTTFNYEVSPVNKSTSLVSKIIINSKTTPVHDTTGYYYHFNKFEHADTVNIPQFPKNIVSSIHRQKRTKQLPIPTDITGIKNILGDTGDSLYPIYRTPRPSDDTSTVATAIFDITRCKVNVYTDNPKTSSGPVLKFTLPKC
ncbi:hypothetical protein LOTGIDRAFT_231453 [Lottia gigantea]|uniref:Peptidase C45 hydrolase domain-containing protein n=1 Tax=Lottia gigantea TaxID=225164 RepID=V4AXU0_LOTGI|nr:hypothetical protein LOTGIDRAFT_231453 [Lottia gigantea]ESO98431.1 hypothetical protein LOTGIDRAFT_231453 [Lottia gigantea]